MDVFRESSRAKQAHARDVAARPVKAGDQAKSDRLSNRREYDWDGRSGRLGRERRR
jgi:hypothetical protein